MQNIDPLFLLQPILVIVISLAVMMYWYFKRRFHLGVWLYSLIAYFGAIGLKYAVQIPTAGLIGTNPYVQGAYLGLQTVAFEVGLAYLIAWYAISHHKLDVRDAEAYGSGLAFWENAVFLGALSLLNMVTYYYILASGGELAQTLYNQLNTAAPTLFAPTTEVLGLVALGILERLSSMLIHIAFGYLCFMAIIYRDKRLFLLALPMGLVDFFVPFAQNNMLLFEGLIFAIAIDSVLAAWLAVKLVKDKSPTAQAPTLPNS
ncbi:MAG: YhfC family intramembrane metalloprotease [Candidatus Bathyarchaeota archaeon]|nr:YhfC family intramembrane metalloprotease [Candidatus Bathyarchaeota archaeon]